MNYNVAIIGAGPAGIFAALEITKLKPEWNVVLIEKGERIEKRVCLLREGYEKCPNCKKCGLLCGWGGAGAFSDGKLTLTPDVGGHLDDYMAREKVEELMGDAGIIRNRLKIKAAVTNARVFIKIREEHGSFANYLWGWTGGETIRETGKSSSPLSDSVSKDLKKRGMKFVGTTVIYAYLQAVGVIWSHEEGYFLARPDAAAESGE